MLRLPSQSPPSAAIFATFVYVFVFGFAARAIAQDAALAPAREKPRLEYRAPPECPDGENFRGLVQSRLPRDWEAPADQLAMQVDVAIAGSPSGYVATMEFLDDGGKRITRAVRGTFCPDVAQGIALITALAIQSRDEPLADRNAPDNAPDSAQPANDSAAPPLAPSPPVAELPRASAVPEARSVPGRVAPVESGPSPPLPGIRLRTSVRAALAQGIGPKLASGVGVGAVIERRSARVGVAFQGFWSGRVDARGVPAHFELFSARLDGCPFAPQLTPAISIEPCAFLELGRLTGEAFQAPPAVVRGFPGSALWLSTGGDVRLVGRLGMLTLELEGLFGAPLRRERFTLADGRELHEVPVVYGALALGVGVLL